MRACIVGIGFWGNRVVKEYISMLNEGILDSVTACDVDSSKLKPFVGKCKTSTDLNKTLKEVNMIHICTPNYSHYDLARKALENNINALIEKPMAEDVNHAFDLVELAMKKGAILQVGHIFRFANVVRAIKQLFDNGDLGEQYYFNMEWTHSMLPIKDVDVVYDLLPHPLDIINFITGRWPITFKGVGKTLRRKELAEAAFIEAIYTGFFANIHLSWVCAERKRKLDIIGTKKTVSADCVKQTARVFEGSQIEDLVVNPNNTIRDEILNFIESIKTGKSDFNSSIVGARSIQMINEASKSIETVPNVGSIE